MGNETEVQSIETEYVRNQFGVVTNKRVVYFRNKGWFSGGSRQDIPLKHVTSVRLDTSRKPFGGVLLLLVGVGLVASGSVLSLVGILVLVLAALLLWGSPTVVVNTAGNDLNVATGFPWVREEASAFVETLRTQLFSN